MYRNVFINLHILEWFLEILWCVTLQEIRIVMEKSSAATVIIDCQNRIRDAAKSKINFQVRQIVTL